MHREKFHNIPQWSIPYCARNYICPITFSVLLSLGTEENISLRPGLLKLNLRLDVDKKDSKVED